MAHITLQSLWGPGCCSMGLSHRLSELSFRWRVSDLLVMLLDIAIADMAWTVAGFTRITRFQIFFIFIPIWGNDLIWRAYFSNGLVQPPPDDYDNHSCQCRMNLYLRCVLFVKTCIFVAWVPFEALFFAGSRAKGPTVCRFGKKDGHDVLVEPRVGTLRRMQSSPPGFLHVYYTPEV